MKPFETLDSFVTPDGKELTLHRRDREVAIYLDGDELMANRSPDSEKALATLALAELTNPTPRILIGGLGLGYTLRAALETSPRGSEVVVAEFFACVEAWGKTHLADLHGGAFADPRVRIVIDDVNRVIGETKGRWDAILLDVDNGPDAWCLGSNGRLYARHGLDRIREALAPGGILAVWSAHQDTSFVRLLRKAEFEVRTETVRAFAGKGARHTIFLAKVPMSNRRRRPSRR
ncbi:MAG: spermidine synthase [Thermoanaerobaculia bacterium]|nr:spermidine synthase [Thermoanaerobaculia bacterium]